MLGQRIVTAVILLAILAAAMMSANPWWFVALLALAAANWEWLRLTLPQPPSPLICAGVPVLLFAAMLALSSAWLGRPSLDPGLCGARRRRRLAVRRRDRRGSRPLRRVPASLGWSLFSVPAAFVAWAVLAQMYIARAAFVCRCWRWSGWPISPPILPAARSASVNWRRG